MAVANGIIGYGDDGNKTVYGVFDNTRTSLMIPSKLVICLAMRICSFIMLLY